ncbi:hypothetical protein DM01DRAFT_1404400 [Hesseltinella vesiculosa]|uniref:Uncharacterized protein n=1 Tax=Hesseltinella vesiculosa TaxID=101127 RepID=A0A1X2GVP0_9FUNG|nr:hypothetical protein DM01DRAFT_1404400 [Hesseltinella vesiculosa]
MSTLSDHYDRLVPPMYRLQSPYYTNPYYPHSPGMMAYPTYHHPSTPFNATPYGYPATMPPMTNGFVPYGHPHQPHYPYYPREPSCFEGCCSSDYDAYAGHMGEMTPYPHHYTQTAFTKPTVTKPEPAKDPES